MPTTAAPSVEVLADDLEGIAKEEAAKAALAAEDLYHRQLVSLNTF